MMQDMFGDTAFFALVTALAFAAGRALKRLWPSLPPSVLPWVVVGFAFGVAFGDAIALGMGWRSAASAALSGLLSGAIAVGGHEMLKGVLVPVVGAPAAEVLLGKLRAAPPPPPADPDATRKTSTIAIVLAGLLSLGAGGCAGWLPAVLDAVVTAGQYAQLVRGAVDAADRASRSWFGQHPEPDVEQHVDDALARCRLALDALDKAALAARKTGDADLAAAKRAVAEAYSDLYALLELGGAMGAGPGESRRPSDGLITPAELGALL